MQGIDLKELQALITLLRKNGVNQFEANGLKLTLAQAPAPIRRKRRGKAESANLTPEVNPLDPVSDGWDSLTEEQKLLWSTNEQAPNAEGETPEAGAA